MQSDSKSSVTAHVDVSQARFSLADYKLEFTNTIDVWTQMEFRTRHQINSLRSFGSVNFEEPKTQMKTYFYGTLLAFE
jgi:hypothetical protein